MEIKNYKLKISLILFTLIIFGSLFSTLIPVHAIDVGINTANEAMNTAGYGNAPLPVVVGKIIKIVLEILGIVAVVLIIAGGVMWMTSGGNEEQISKAKKLMIAAVIGLIIVLSAWAIVYFILNRLQGITNGGGGGSTCTPGACCAYGYAYDSDCQCTVPDDSCIHGIPVERFLVIRGDADFDTDNNVYRCSRIKPVFNHSLKSSTINEAIANNTLKIVDSNTSAIVSGEWNIIDKAIQFKPNNFLDGNTNYQAIIPKEIKDINNYSLKGCSQGFTPDGYCSANSDTVIWSFRTNNILDTTSPIIISSYPIKADQQNYPDKWVSRAPIIDIGFSENIDLSTVINMNAGYNPDDSTTWHPILDNFKIEKLDGQDGNASSIIDSNKLLVGDRSQGFLVHLVAPNLLEPFTWYRITVKNIKDLCGNTMSSEEVWEFETNDQIPGVQDWWPKGDNICPDAPIGIRFGTSMYDNEINIDVINKNTNSTEFAATMKPSEIGSPYQVSLSSTGSGLFSVLDNDDSNISNQFKIFQLTLDSGLDEDTSYTIKVTTDLVINSQQDTLEKSWDFDVSNMGTCACSPIIYQVSPNQGPRSQCVTISGYCFQGTTQRPAQISKLQFDDNGGNDGAIDAIIEASTANSITTVVPQDFGNPVSEIPDPLGIRVGITYIDNSSYISGESWNQFTVSSNDLANGPCLWSLSPNEGKINTKFQANGIRFGDYDASLESAVKMQDWPDNLVISGLPNSWTNNQINNITVPNFSTSGERNVTIIDEDGNSSNPVPYNVIFNRPKVKKFGCNPTIKNYSSPDPYENSEDACTNIDLIVEFDKAMGLSVLDEGNYSLYKCNSGNVFDNVSCATTGFSLDWYTSPNVIKIIPDAKPFDKNTWYKAEITGDVASTEGVEMGDSYTWHFKTRDSDVCPIDKIDILPDGPFNLVGCSKTQSFIAYPFNNNCNALTPNLYKYSWDSSNTNVVTISGSITNTETATAVGSGSTRIKVVENDSQKFDQEDLNANCCATDKQCFDPDGDNSNRCAGSVCNDEYGICTPVINNFDPESGALHDWVTINGCWFNNYDPNYGSLVEINGSNANIPISKCGAGAWQNEQIIAEVSNSENVPENGPIKVTTAPYGGSDFTATSSDLFAVTNGPKHIGICNLYPSHGTSGEITNLSTQNLADQSEGDALYYGDVSANSYPSPGWDVINQKIYSEIPSGVIPGQSSVKVKQNGVYSNSLSFTIDQSTSLNIEENSTCDAAHLIIPSPNPQPGTQLDCTNIAISARFNKLIQDNTINNDTVFVQPCSDSRCDQLDNHLSGTLMVGSVNDYQEKFKFTPDSDLTAGYSYQVTVKGGPNGVKAEDGSIMGKDYAWQFKIYDNPSTCEIENIIVYPVEKTLIPEPNIANCSSNCSQDYNATALGQNCLELIGNYPWSWESSSLAVATVGSSSNSANTATAVGLGETYIKATIGNVSGNAHLIVATHPEVDADSVMPADNASDVCRNAIISATFDQLMDKSTINEDSVGVYQETPIGTSCSSLSFFYEKKNIFVKLFYKLKNILFEKVSAKLVQDISSEHPEYHFCKIKADISTFDNEDNKTVVNLRTDLLEANKNYKVVIEGGSLGVKSKYSVEMKDDFSWEFTTGNQICKLSKVEISPKTFIFNSQGQQQQFTAQAYDNKGNEIQGISDVYEWSWSWESSNLDIVTIPNTNQFSQMATANNKNGTAQITATAKIVTDEVFNPSTVENTFSDTSLIKVFLCENPWPSSSDFPFNDSTYNYNLFYCRDAGEEGTQDDLPELNNPPSEGQIGGNLIKNLLFNVSDTNDAIGLQIYKNPDHLTPLQWYTKYAPNPGTANSLFVDGYYSIQSGRTIYVGATNITDSDSASIDTYIYILSYNQDANPETINIFNQLLNNWEFNTNKDNDDNYLVSQDDKAKIQRDLMRIYDVNSMVSILDQYKNEYGYYPKLESGSFIRGMSVSKWPSWVNPQGQFVSNMPIDPINQFNGICAGCTDKPDGQCNGTCYNDDPSMKKYQCITGSNIYQYMAKDDGTDYRLYLNLEYANPDIWDHNCSDYVTKDECLLHHWCIYCSSCKGKPLDCNSNPCSVPSSCGCFNMEYKPTYTQMECSQVMD